MLDLERMKDVQGNPCRIARLGVDFVWASGN